MPSLTAKIRSASSRGVILFDFASGERAIKSVTPSIAVFRTSRTSCRTPGLRAASAKRSTTNAEVHLRGVLAAVRGKKNFERLEQTRRLPGAFQHILNFGLVPVGHGRDHSLFVFEIAINQTHTDSGLGANVVHAGLVKAALGKTNHGGIKNLFAAIRGRFDSGFRHGTALMNERSFIVKLFVIVNVEALAAASACLH